MSNDTSDHNLIAIRQLLLAAFTPESLRRFLEDHQLFRPIVAEFGPGHGLTDMVDEAVTYCRTHLLLDELLAEVREVNPRQYARFIQPKLSKAERKALTVRFKREVAAFRAYLAENFAPPPGPQRRPRRRISVIQKDA